MIFSTEDEDTHTQTRKKKKENTRKMPASFSDRGKRRVEGAGARQVLL